MPHLFLGPCSRVANHNPDLFLHILAVLGSHLRALKHLQRLQRAQHMLRVGAGGADGADGDNQRLLVRECVGEDTREQTLAEWRLPLPGAQDAETLFEREDRAVDVGRVFTPFRIVMRGILPALAARTVHKRQHRFARGEGHAKHRVRARRGVVGMRGTSGAALLRLLAQAQEVLGTRHLKPAQTQDARALVCIFEDAQLLPIGLQQVRHVLPGDLEGRHMEWPARRGRRKQLPSRMPEHPLHRVRFAAASLAEHENGCGPPCQSTFHGRGPADVVDVDVAGALVEGLGEVEVQVGDKEPLQICLREAVVHDDLALVNIYHIELSGVLLLGEYGPLAYENADNGVVQRR
mmetsp:Transcript_49352/g.125357  ORF Transcript_49352/g.125357 Transcript_49352/m.125357 type:complete len:349 (+) Transcript_49352:273-1319(+)